RACRIRRSDPLHVRRLQLPPGCDRPGACPRADARVARARRRRLPLGAKSANGVRPVYLDHPALGARSGSGERLGCEPHEVDRSRWVDAALLRAGVPPGASSERDRVRRVPSGRFRGRTRGARGRAAMTPTRTSHKGGTHPTREGEAPPKEFFAARRPAAGNHGVAIVLGPVRVELHGLDDARARLLLDRYAPYATPASDESQGLRVRVGLEDREYYLDPPAGPEFTAVFVTHDPPSAVRYLSYKVAGWLDVATLRGELLLASGTWEPDLRSFENYVRVAVAWL